MTPLELVKAELTLEQRWRATPWQLVYRFAGKLGLKVTDEDLYARLFGCVDDAGTFPADNRPLGERLGRPRSRPRSALERIAAAGLVHLYEVDGRAWGQIRDYEELVGLQQKKRVIYPGPSESGRESATESAKFVVQSPPTPPSIKHKSEKGRGETAHTPALDLGEQQDERSDDLAEGEVIELRLPRASKKAARGSDAPGRAVVPREQLGLEVEPTKLGVSVERAMVSWVECYERIRAELPGRAQRLPPDAIVRQAFGVLEVECGARAVRAGVAQAIREAEAGDRAYWGRPIENIERLVRWKWQKVGHHDDEPKRLERQGVEEGPRQSDEGEGVRVARPAPSPEASELWRVVSARIAARIDAWDYAHWIKPMVCQSLEPVQLLVPDESHAAWVREHFGSVLEDALEGRAVVFEPW